MRRLHLQFYLAILATIALFVIATMIFWHVSLPMRRDSWGIEAAGQFATALLPASEASASERDEKLDELRKQLRADLGLYDSQGRLLAATGHLPNLSAAEVLQESGRVVRRGGPMWIVPLEDGRRLLVRPSHEHRHGQGVRMLALPVALLLAIALGAYPIARRLTARLARLQAGVQRWGEGNLSARVKVEGRDEVAAVARSFNESAARIEELVQAHKMLLANCSHELRTPLARIRLAIERLSAEPNTVARAEIARSIAELDALIGEMLLASRLDALRTLERTEDVDLLALIAEEASHFEREVEGQLIIVRGDPALLRRLVRNLLDNAARHAGGATRIRVDVGACNRAVLIVEDRGAGIPELDRARIFEPFYQSSSSDDRGNGLGLSIVRQIARAHGGDVQYESVPEGGSRFVVRLPKAP